MTNLTPGDFPDYELIDSGDFEKIERFGPYTLIRPEPQAVWKRVLEPAEWERRAHVRFVPQSSSAGTWKKCRDMPDRWQVCYPLEGRKLTFRLALTGFKHVGLFPEQAVNWDFIHRSVKSIGGESRVLNLFAYTGAASLAARAAGADVTHLDAVKQVVTWARDNMELSGLDGVRWLVEDAMTYVKRENRRGRRYQGIVLDPPAYGHGPDGQRWKLEDQVCELVQSAAALLDPERHFFVLNTYSLGFSPLILRNIMMQTPLHDHFECGEIFLSSATNQQLPLGVYARAFKG